LGAGFSMAGSTSFGWMTRFDWFSFLLGFGLALPEHGLHRRVVHLARVIESNNALFRLAQIPSPDCAGRFAFSMPAAGGGDDKSRRADS
jgi:hypothetical protein